MARKSKKTGSYSKCGARTTKKSSISQLEWRFAVVDDASRWLLALCRIYYVYEALKPWIAQHLLSS